MNFFLARLIDSGVFQMAVANIISEILYGVRYTYDDCEPLRDFVETFGDVRLSGKRSDRENTQQMITRLTTSPLRFLQKFKPVLKLLPGALNHTNNLIAADGEKVWFNVFDGGCLE